MAPIRGRPAARGTWHVPPREGLQKVVDAPTGQTGGTADPKLAGHTYTTPTCKACLAPYDLMSWGAVCTCSAFVVAVPVWCRLHARGEENFFDMGSSGLRKL